MANRSGKAVDKTFLSVDNAENRGFLHRDYIAHCLRWTHVVKFLGTSMRYKESRILDVGCGKEMPLAKLLHSSRMAPAWYGAVDVTPLTTPAQFANASWKPDELYSKTDVCDLSLKDLPSKLDVIVCFEVVEHVEADHCRRMLTKFSELLDDEGVLFVSTPCWDPAVGAAGNHVNEMRYEAFGATLEDIGYTIESQHGTFASIKDYRDALTHEQRTVFDELRAYYDTNYLSTIFAPLYPQHSRNCLWRCTFQGRNNVRKFDPLRDQEQPWGSSEHWQRLDPSYDSI